MLGNKKMKPHIIIIDLNLTITINIIEESHQK